jgi:CRP-like cAMP-binding protein
MTNPSNQEHSEHTTAYDPNVALEFFKLFGSLESANEGKKFFVYGQASFFSFLQTDKTYFLVEGKISVQTASGNTVNIEPGEIFGEFAPYATQNATAIANTSCRIISLGEKQLTTGLKKNPEFLFMLMDVLVMYIPKPGTETTANKKPKKDIALNSKMLDELKEILGEKAHTVVPEKRVIFQKGAAASLMYVILDGYMTISVDDKIVGRSGPGDIVGEIALVVKHSRTASVVAETRCSLLAINRQTLLELIQKHPGFGISLLRVLASR